MSIQVSQGFAELSYLVTVLQELVAQHEGDARANALCLVAGVQKMVHRTPAQRPHAQALLFDFDRFSPTKQTPLGKLSWFAEQATLHGTTASVAGIWLPKCIQDSVPTGSKPPAPGVITQLSTQQQRMRINAAEAYQPTAGAASPGSDAVSHSTHPDNTEPRAHVACGPGTCGFAENGGGGPCNGVHVRVPCSSAQLLASEALPQTPDAAAVNIMVHTLQHTGMPRHLPAAYDSGSVQGQLQPGVYMLSPITPQLPPPPPLLAAQQHIGPLQVQGAQGYITPSTAHNVHSWT